MELPIKESMSQKQKTSIPPAEGEWSEKGDPKPINHIWQSANSFIMIIINIIIITILITIYMQSS